MDIASDTPTAEQLASLSKACSQLWKLDDNHFRPGIDYQLNLQHGKTSYEKADVADQPLFGKVDKQLFMAKPTFKAFYNLLDNYERETGKAEVVTAEEKQENLIFIDAICETKCIKYLHKYLISKGKAKASVPEFKKQLYSIWFELYARTGRINDSSGFEHVFLGEIKNGAVIGFHNWIQFFIEEKRGNVDYKGYIINKKRNRSHEESADNTTRVITIQFSWGHETKSMSSTLIGTSPEFEIALYTLCFLCGGEDNIIKLGEYTVTVKVHHWNTKGGDKIGSCYPIAELGSQ